MVRDWLLNIFYFSAALALRATPNWINGSQINIFGKDAPDYNNGIQMFAVKDYNTYNFSILELKPNGELWLQQPGTQVANLLSDAAIVSKLFGQNSGYINYASGLIIQWGGSLLSQNPITITLPISFSKNNSAISVITSYSKDNLAYFYGSITENGSSIIVGANADNKAFKFITIGH